MKLPNAAQAIVERDKISGYLLNPGHRYGASKARFFTEFGFRVEAWQVLADALHEHGCTQKVALVRETSFGQRYAVEGELITPSGREPRVRTVWQLDKGAVAPRLISAYPVEAKL